MRHNVTDPEPVTITSATEPVISSDGWTIPAPRTGGVGSTDTLPAPAGLVDAAPRPIDPALTDLAEALAGRTAEAIAPALAELWAFARRSGHDLAVTELAEPESMDPRTIQLLLGAGAAIERERQADPGRVQELRDLFDVVLPAADWRLLAGIPAGLVDLVAVLGRIWDSGHLAGSEEAWSMVQEMALGKVAEADAERDALTRADDEKGTQFVRTLGGPQETGR